jgi:hypothetical protein
MTEPFLLIGVLFVIPNATRWNAWFDSVNHVVKLLDANGNIEQQEKMSENLNLLCEHHGIGDFKSQEILFMQEYVSLMQPIAIALDVLQGETARSAGESTKKWLPDREGKGKNEPLSKFDIS